MDVDPARRVEATLDREPPDLRALGIHGQAALLLRETV